MVISDKNNIIGTMIIVDKDYWYRYLMCLEYLYLVNHTVWNEILNIKVN